jgi:hypothetical protein
MISGSTDIKSFDLLVGGLCDIIDSDPFCGNTGQAAPAKAQNFQGATPGITIAESGSVFGKQSDVAKINEDVNGCAPGSAARSLAYLDAQHASVQLPNKDPAKDDAQEAYDALYVAMKTNVDKKGTSKGDFLTGKQEYSKTSTPKVKTTQTIKVDDAIKTLKKKGDVELMVYWGKNAAGKSMGGHAAFISDLIKLSDGSFTVTIIDDPKQGDGNPANNKYTLKFDSLGNLQGYGTGAKLIGFQVETVPEPGSLWLAAVGLGWLGLRRRLRPAR